MNHINHFSKEDIAYVLEKCGFSEEMRAFLVEGNHVPGYSLVDIICQAPISLDEKIEVFNYLIQKKNLRVSKNWREERSLATYLFSAFVETERARLWYESSDDLDIRIQIYYLFLEWYDTDAFVEKSCGNGLMKAIEDAVQYAKIESQDSDGEDWHRVEQWSLCDWGRKDERYNYYIYDGKICWFERMQPRVDEADGSVYYMPESIRFTSGRSPINLPTPYKTGDIVSIDCRPFGPPFHALILESQGQYDGSFPTIVFNIPYTDKWRMTSLKYKMFFKDAELSFYEPMLSPLFRLRKVTEEEMTEDDSKLSYLSNILQGGEEKAAVVYRAWNDSDFRGISFDEVEKAFETIRNKEITYGSYL